MSDTKEIRLTVNLFFEVPEDYEVTGKEFLKLAPVGTGVYSEIGEVVTETLTDKLTVEVVEVN